MHRSPRRREAYALLVVIVFMLAILLWPSPVDAPISGALSSALASLHHHGAPGWVDYNLVESVANVLLFVPLGAFVASLMTMALWWASGVFGLALSLIVEFAQAELLTARFASAGDLITNTIGALVGGGVLALLRHRRVRSDQART